MAGLAVLTFMLLSVVFVSFHQAPPMPNDWSAVDVKMPRDQVLSMYSDMQTGMRSVKGFDTLTVENERPDYTDGFWKMEVYYSDDDSVEGVICRYVDRKCRLFNKASSRGWYNK